MGFKQLANGYRYFNIFFILSHVYKSHQILAYDLNMGTLKARVPFLYREPRIAPGVPCHELRLSQERMAIFRILHVQIMIFRLLPRFRGRYRYSFFQYHVSLKLNINPRGTLVKLGLRYYYSQAYMSYMNEDMYKFLFLWFEENHL